MKSFVRSDIFKLLLLLFFKLSLATDVSSQIREQTSFSSETKVLYSVKLPPAILHKLAFYDDNQLKKCQENPDLRENDIQKHFAASRIQINDDKLNDFIIQSQTQCFMGAHNTTFWLFIAEKNKKGNGYRQLFDIASDDLKILKTKTNKHRDVETSSLTANEVSTILWKFDSEKYKPAKCWREGETTNGRIEVKCN